MACPLLDEPLLVSLLARDDFDCLEGALYVYGSSAEQRSAIDDSWQARQAHHGTEFIEIMGQERDSLEYRTAAGAIEQVALGSKGQAQKLIATDPARPVYLDVTGLSHHVWAPLMRACVDVKAPLFVVYMEPRAYTLSRQPQRGSFYDLSERTDGIRPLPTFAYLRPERFDESLLVPLLGFEGARFAQIMGHVEPALNHTFPIVGVPGFRSEYPFVTYWGNESQLQADRTWLNIRYSVANDPFDLFHVLRVLFEEHPTALMKVAPIGTKPHSVGAVLFALSRTDSVELIYDNPVRKAARTSGAARLCLYDVGSFLQSDLFAWSADCALGVLPR